MMHPYESYYLVIMHTCIIIKFISGTEKIKLFKVYNLTSICLIDFPFIGGL